MITDTAMVFSRGKMELREKQERYEERKKFLKLEKSRNKDDQTQVDKAFKDASDFRENLNKKKEDLNNF